jgi:hypothetical protein
VLATIAVAVLLSFGNGGHGRGWAGFSHPAALALSVPGLASIIPERFALLVDLAMAWLIAQVCDELVRLARGRMHLVAVGVCAALLAAVAVSWIPAPPEQQTNAAVPTFFTSRAAAAVGGGIVLVLPAPSHADDSAMLYQAMSGMRFSMAGSYALTADRRGRQETYAQPDPLSQVAAYRTTVTTSMRCSTLAALRSDGVTTVVVTPSHDPGGQLDAAADNILGAPTAYPEVDVWRVPRTSAGCGGPVVSTIASSPSRG